MIQNYEEMVFKRTIIHNLVTELKNKDEQRFIELWNEYVSDIYEDDRRICANTNDGFDECVWGFDSYDIAVMVSKGKYTDTDAYVTRKDGLIYSLDSSSLDTYIDILELVAFIVDGRYCFDIDAYLDRDMFALNRDRIIKELVSLSPCDLDFNKVHRYFIDNNVNFVSEMIDMDVWDTIKDIVKPSPKLLTKTDVWNAMKKILDGRNLHEEVWKNTLEFNLAYRTKLIYWGELVDTSLVEITLRKDRNGNDIIVLTSIATIDGEDIRDYDDVTHFSYDEMLTIYNMMVENI